jgi:hypothetical protein
MEISKSQEGNEIVETDQIKEEKKFSQFLAMKNKNFINIKKDTYPQLLDYYML